MKENDQRKKGTILISDPNQLEGSEKEKAEALVKTYEPPVSSNPYTNAQTGIRMFSFSYKKDIENAQKKSWPAYITVILLLLGILGLIFIIFS
ncbi:MAG: hypothetical protein R6W96_04560 [Clostridia bacterium]